MVVARVKTRGAPGYTFILEDYAWGDPGDTIVAGQTQAEPSPNLPVEGSLGLLAAGAAMLGAWRHLRAQRPRTSVR